MEGKPWQARHARSRRSRRGGALCARSIGLSPELESSSPPGRSLGNTQPKRTKPETRNGSLVTSCNLLVFARCVTAGARAR